MMMMKNSACLAIFLLALLSKVASGSLLRGGILTCAHFAIEPCQPGAVCKDSPTGYTCERKPDEDKDCPIECQENSKCVKANAFFVCECVDGYFRLNPDEQCQVGTLNHPKQARR